MQEILITFKTQINLKLIWELKKAFDFVSVKWFSKDKVIQLSCYTNKNYNWI